MGRDPAQWTLQMKLVVFDIDGTLTQTMAVTDALFAKAVSEELRTQVSEDWSSYPHVTDSGILEHVFLNHCGRKPQNGEIRSVRNRYLDLLRAECPTATAIPGAARALQEISQTSTWRVECGIAWRDCPTSNRS